MCRRLPRAATLRATLCCWLTALALTLPTVSRAEAASDDAMLVERLATVFDRAFEVAATPESALRLRAESYAAGPDTRFGYVFRSVEPSSRDDRGAMYLRYYLGVYDFASAADAAAALPDMIPLPGQTMVQGCKSGGYSRAANNRLYSLGIGCQFSESNRDRLVAVLEDHLDGAPGMARLCTCGGRSEVYLFD